jgi:hypothetical protein
MVPVLVTDRAIITTLPAWEVSWPSLTIAPFEVPEAASGPPAMKASGFIARVETTRLPPDRMRPPDPTITPLGFIR